MILKLFTPRPPLSEFVELFTFYSDFFPDHRIERLLPEGVVEMVVDLTEDAKFIYDNQSLAELQTCRKAWISGMRSSFISISALPGSSMFVVRFKPGMARPFLQMPVDELENRVVDAECIVPGIGMVREEMIAARSPEAKCRIMQSHLMKRCGDAQPIHSVVLHALNRMNAVASGIAIGEVVGECGYSHKHFIKLFKSEVGTSPKSFLRIMKFQQAIQALECRKNVDWAQLAHECGYYDQAHFINEFRAFCGFSPGDYLKEKGDFVNYIPIA